MCWPSGAGSNSTPREKRRQTSLEVRDSAQGPRSPLPRPLSRHALAEERLQRLDAAIELESGRTSMGKNPWKEYRLKYCSDATYQFLQKLRSRIYPRTEFSGAVGQGFESLRGLQRSPEIPRLCSFRLTLGQPSTTRNRGCSTTVRSERPEGSPDPCPWRGSSDGDVPADLLLWRLQPRASLSDQRQPRFSATFCRRHCLGVPSLFQHILPQTERIPTAAQLHTESV